MILPTIIIFSCLALMPTPAKANVIRALALWGVIAFALYVVGLELV